MNIDSSPGRKKRRSFSRNNYRRTSSARDLTCRRNTYLPHDKNLAIAPPAVIELRPAHAPLNSWPELLRRHWPAWLAIFSIFAIVYLGSISSPAIFDDADATHAEAAREMAANNDWVTLHVDGIRYLEKPPLPY